MDDLDRPYLAPLIKKWGMDKMELITRYPRSAIYQWKPSRGFVPPEAALRVCEYPEAEEEGFTVERLCPDLPWHLLYKGRDRRTTVDKEDAKLDVPGIIREAGITAISRVTGRSRQGIYDAMEKGERVPVWLALAAEQVSDHRFLVEDIRPELPWWTLYNRRKQVRPLDADNRRKLEALING